MPALLPLLAIFAIFAVISGHSKLFPNIEPPKKSAAVQYGEAFKELLDGIHKPPKKDDPGG